MESWQVNKFFEQFFSISPDAITILVVVVCGALFIGSFTYEKLRAIFPDWMVSAEKLRAISPSLMVSAGIIGTFWGTFIALADFQTGAEASGAIDHNVMVESIPKVLSGMKSAFVTSLIGLLSAFVSKIAFQLLPKSQPKPLQIEEDSINLLKEIKNGIIGEGDKSLSSQLHLLQAEYRDSAQDLKQSISGSSDSSIASQLIKLRNENGEGFKELKQELEGLSEAISGSLTKSIENLIEELRTTIREQLTKELKATNEVLRVQLREMLERIEEALIKQFGETFKQFNEATQAIKKWQEEHRQHVEELTEAFEVAATGIDEIRVNCESIPDTMEQLKTLMGELDDRLKAFADMKKSAEESFPAIKQHLDDIGADLQKSAAGFDGLEATITAAYNQANNLAQRHIEIAEKHIDNVGTKINETSEQVATASKDMIAETRNASNKYREDMNDIVRAVEKTSQDTQNRLSRLADDYANTMGEKMDAIGKAWGKQMVGIAERVAGVIENIDNKR